MSEDVLRDERDSARARLSTAEQNYERLKEKLRSVFDMLGAREKANGAIEIDYDVLVERLGVDGWLELRRIGDERYKVSGAAGEKPKVRAKAKAA